MAETVSEKNYRVTVSGNAADEGSKIAQSSISAANAIDKFDTQAKVLSASLRRLKGNSVEVKTAKASLKKEIDSARNESSRLSLQLLKEKTSYEAASKAAKKHKDVLAGSKKRGEDKRQKIKDGGGLAGSFLKIKDAGKRFGELRSATGSTGGALKAMASEANVGASALGMVGSATAVAGAAAAAAAVAVVALAVGIVAFTIRAAEASAAANRLRQALWGNKQDAKNLGDQVVDLAGKVPQGTDELNKLALSLSKTRLSGTATVNTMNAVAQAAGAVDDAAGAKIQEIITRQQQTGRMQLGRRELQGTGLDFTGVAEAYAKVSKKSVKQAQADLLSGRASLENGAEAFRLASEKKFGKINKASAFSLTNAPKKFFDQISSLASGVDLSGLSDPLEEVFNQLKPGSPLGAGIKSLMEMLGGGFVYAAKIAIPAVLEGLTWLVVGALKVGTEFYLLKRKVKDAFATDGYVGAGKEIMYGLAKGLRAWFGAPVDAIKWVAKKVIGAFRDDMEIKSPSRLFQRFGKHIPGGAAAGIRAGTSEAVKATQEMGESIEAAALGPKIGGGSAGYAMAPASVTTPAAPMASASMAPTTVHLHFSNMTEDDARGIAGNSGTVATLTKIVVDALKVSGRGSPVAA